MSIPSSQDPLECFPDEVINKIFKPFFAGSFESRGGKWRRNYSMLILVCKGWRAYFQPPCELWKDTSLEFRLEDSQKCLAKARWLKGTAPVVKRLQIGVINRWGRSEPVEEAALWRGVAEALQGADLKVLGIHRVRNSQDAGSLEMLGSTLAGLECLTVSGLRQEAELKSLSSFVGLQQLFLDSSVVSTNDTRWRFFDPSLFRYQPLVLEPGEGSFTSFPQSVLALTQLRRLALRLDGPMSFPVPTEISCLVKLQALETSQRINIGSAVAGLPGLTFLNANDLGRQTTDVRFPLSLQRLAYTCCRVPLSLARCTAITRLELHYNKVDDDEGIDRVLGRLPSLHTLCLWSNEWETALAVTATRKLRVLDVCVQNYDFAYADGVLPRGEWVAHLQHVTLSDLPRIPQSLAEATNLESLDISGIDRLDGYQIEMVFTLPKLRKLALGSREVREYYAMHFGSQKRLPDGGCLEVDAWPKGRHDRRRAAPAQLEAPSWT